MVLAIEVKVILLLEAAQACSESKSLDIGSSTYLSVPLTTIEDGLPILRIFNSGGKNTLALLQAVSFPAPSGPVALTRIGLSAIISKIIPKAHSRLVC